MHIVLHRSRWRLYFSVSGQSRLWALSQCIITTTSQATSMCTCSLLPRVCSSVTSRGQARCSSSFATVEAVRLLEVSHWYWARAFAWKICGYLI
jgi:hypothetical protein